MYREPSFNYNLETLSIFSALTTYISGVQGSGNARISVYPRWQAISTLFDGQTPINHSKVPEGEKGESTRTAGG